MIRLLPNTPLINYLLYNISTFISTKTDCVALPVTTIADGGNGQLVITTSDVSNLTFGVAINITGTTNYNGDYTVLSIDAGLNTFNVSGTFGVTEVGVWEFSSAITGSQAGTPLDFGTITFYNNADKITLQDTYMDRNGTLPNANPIVTDIIGSFPPVYLQDISYYIVIKDKFNNLVAELDNYFPFDTQEIPTQELPLGNLFADYGFTIRLNEKVYAENSLPTTVIAGISGGTYWQIANAPGTNVNTYSFNDVSQESLIGNPKNEVVLKSELNSSGKTINRLRFSLGDYNSFQGLAVVFSIYTQAISGSEVNLACQLIRTKQNVDETPLPIGAINITSTRTQRLLSFTVPPLSSGDYFNNDKIDFIIDLPLNSALEYAFTGRWLQLSTDGTLDITEEADSQDAAKEFFGGSFRGQQQAASNLPDVPLTTPSNSILYLPVASGEGDAVALNKTGHVFTAPKATSFNYALEMLPSVELTRNKKLNNIDTTRLLIYLRSKGVLPSPNTLVGTKVSTDQIDWGTGIGTKEKTTWVANAGGRVTLTKATNELIYHLKCAHKNNKVTFTFTDNFAPGVVAYDPQYTFAIGIPGSRELYHIRPSSHPIVNWVGDNELQSQVDARDRYSENQRLVFKSAFKISTIDLGTGSTPAIVEIEVPDSNLSKMLKATSREFPDISPITWSPSTYGSIPSSFENATNTYDSVIHYHWGGVPTNQVDFHTNFPTGFLSYNSSATNPATHPYPPRRMIKFRVDGVSNALAGVESTAEVHIRTGMTGFEVAKAIHDKINTSFKYDMKFTALPDNADHCTISTALTDYVVIWWDIALAKPINPDPTHIPIYVEFVTTDTIAQVRDKTHETIEYSQIGVPLPQALALNDDLSYYIVM